MKRKPIKRSSPAAIREWQRRSKPMPRGGPPKRRTRLRPFGRKKRREKRQGLVDGPLCDLVREMPCCVCGKPGPSHPHHVAGGTLRRDYLPDGSGGVAPLCFTHHVGDEGVHTLGPETFRARFEVNLQEIAKEIGNGT